MKIWQFPSFGIDHLEQKSVPIPAPGAGEVLVKIHAVSLNYRDLLTIRGEYNPKMRLPSIPCSDAAGEIIEVGEGVDCRKPGERVAGIFMQSWMDGKPSPERCRGALGGDVPGVLQEYRVFPQHGVVPIPQKLTYLQAATLPCAGVTAWNAVMHSAELQAGDVVVIQGTGGVSIFALQFSLLIGAKVLGTSSSDEKLQRALAMGMDRGLNYKHSPDWSGWVMEQTQKRGAQLIVEVGGAGTLNQSIKAVCMGGVIAQIGILSESNDPLQITRLLHRQLELKGIYVGSRARFEEMNRAIENSSMEPVVDKIFSFDQVPEALRVMESGSHFGKIVIQMIP